MILTTAAVTVTVDTRAPLNRIVPQRAIGAGVDAEYARSVATFFGPADVAAMLSAGLGPVSYRLYTELSVQDWHWNPAGSWSDAARADGYWTGSSTPGAPIAVSYGYVLPHGGFTFDQGSNSGYSRLDDGDPATYWKSDPYLAAAYTGDPDSAHPQWVLIDIGTRVPVDAARIAWAAPYATAYAVQYWTGGDALYDPAHGRWKTFNGGAVRAGKGGAVALRFPVAVTARFVRILMTASSGTCDTHGATDPRDCLGYAIDEVSVGTYRGGRFHDWVRHRPDQHQTPAYVSSVDPWHASADRDVRDAVQPGLDAVFQSGLTRGLPAFVPVSLLYGTPDDAVAEIEYLGARGYAVDGVELGEEPDGQFVTPEDDAALYVEWAKRLHAVSPRLALGGPVFQGANSDVKTWPDANGQTSWLKRFLGYLRAHGALRDLAFMSFEHYPYNVCAGDPYANLRTEPQLAAGILDVWRRDGVPANVPFFVTEMNYSGDSGAVFQDVPGALWFADAAGAFLSSGASGVFLYQYLPEQLQRTSSQCNTYGSYGMFTGTSAQRVRQVTAEWYAARFLTTEWAQPVDRAHEIEATTVAGGSGWVSAYGIHRPDGRYALLLVNKDSRASHIATIRFATASGSMRFSGTVRESVFGRAQYVWHGDGPNAYADPDGPALEKMAPASAAYALEPGSIVVLSGSIAR